MQNKRMITHHIKRISVLLIGLSLVACSSVEPNIVNVSTEHINTCVTPPKAGQIVMRTPIFYVVKDVNGVLWIGLTPQDYEKMSINTAEILEHIKKKNAIVRYYKDCVNKNDKNPK